MTATPEGKQLAADLANAEAWRELALRAVALVEDAVKDTNWGQPTFGPDYGEELRAEVDELLAKQEA